MENPNAQPAEPAVKPKGLSSADILSRVSTAIVAAAPRALNSVIDALVSKEIEKRSTAILGGVELASSVRRDLNKAREPDIRPTTFTVDGKPIGEPGWSKPRLAEIKKLTEKLAKIEKVIDGATRDENPDFGPLYNLKSEIEKAEKASVSSADSAEA